MSNRMSNTKLQTILLNFGPQHPAAHGILKISLALSGEVILRSDPQFGLLHRGSEKLIESKTTVQALPYLDRMDYVANLFQEHSFVSAVEKTSQLNRTTVNVNIWRIIFDELSRVLNHLLTMGAVCLDMGSMGPIFWAFEEREQIMELYERVSGARMHTALYKPYGLNGFFFNSSLIRDIIFLVNRGSRYVSGSFLGLLNNKALKTRLSSVGTFSQNKVTSYGVTGVIARASGVSLDLRVKNLYDDLNSYSYLNLKSFIGKRGDSLDRFVVRSREVIESFRLINQAILIVSPINNSKINKFLKMDDLIKHFKYSTNNANISKNFCFSVKEGPKGYVGSYIVINSNFLIYRSHLRSPVAHNMNLITTIGNCANFADFVATFCSLDVVLGEIDR